MKEGRKILCVVLIVYLVIVLAVVGCLTLFPNLQKLYGKSVAIIGGETALSKALPHIRPVLDKAGIKVLDIIHFGGGVLSLEVRKLHKWLL